LLVACAAPVGQPGPWIELRTELWQPLAFGGEGPVTYPAGQLQLDVGTPLTGVRWSGAPPRGDFELELVATKLQGSDFFVGLTFPVGQGFLTLVLGGWGGALCGLSCLDGQDASGNDTKFFRAFESGRPYLIRVRVTGPRVRCWIDGERVVDVDTGGRALSLRTEVEACAPLGLATFLTRARYGGLRWRRR
jgi:hypothetical protein